LGGLNKMEMNIELCDNDTNETIAVLKEDVKDYEEGELIIEGICIDMRNGNEKGYINGVWFTKGKRLYI